MSDEKVTDTPKINIEEIFEFESGPIVSNPLWFVARGHVDKQEFVSEILREFERAIPIEFVEHAYMRFVPTGRKGEKILDLARPGRRGAFPVTYIDLWCV